MRSWTWTDYAWAAGLFDGEGSISAHYLMKKRPGYPDGRLVLRVSLGMTSKKAVRQFFSIIGVGSIHRRQTSTGKEYFQWSASFCDGSKALDLLYADLKVKVKQADLYCQLAAEMEGHRGPRLTERIKSWRRNRVERLQGLNA
jgi:hypothetical protein